LLELEPAHEETHRALMQLYAEQGARELAFRQYQLCRDSLKRELDVEPQAETRSLLEAIKKPMAA
jgi:DNA-binding SARP family transcriptional activator